MGVVVLSDVVAVDVAEVDVDVVVKESLITLRSTGQHKLNFFLKIIYSCLGIRYLLICHCI